MKNIYLGLFATSFLALSSQSNAEITEIDWLVEGDNLAFYDSMSGKSFLDLSQTSGMSIDDVVSQLSTTFNGWKLATESDLDSLNYSLTGSDVFTKTVNEFGTETTSFSIEKVQYDYFSLINGGDLFVQEMNKGYDTYSKERRLFGFFINDLGDLAYYGTESLVLGSNEGDYNTVKVRGVSNPEHPETYASTPFHGVYLVFDGIYNLSSSTEGGSVGGGSSSGGSSGSGSGDITTSPDGEVSDVPAGAFGLGLLSFGLFARRKKK